MCTMDPYCVKILVSIRFIILSPRHFLSPSFCAKLIAPVSPLRARLKSH